MKPKQLFPFFIFVLIAQLVQAQQTLQPDAKLHARLQQYVATNHLHANSMYVYFDTVIKKPVTFRAGDCMVVNYNAHPANRTSNNIISTTGTESFHLVKDVNTFTDADISNGDHDGTSRTFAMLNKVVYFSANDGIHGTELWRSDGTAAGTYMVKDIRAGELSSNPINIAISGSEVFFVVVDYAQGNYNYFALWKTDGTAAGTRQVKDFTNVAVSPSLVAIPYNLCDVNGTLYFTIGSNQIWDQLWKSDGTNAGTRLVKDFNAIGGSFVRSLVALNGLLYFIGSDATHGAEVWRSNGTAAGTFMLKDNYPNSDTYNGPAQLTPYNGKLYFAEKDWGNWSRLWVTDGTAAGTVPVNGFYDSWVDYSVYNNMMVNTPFTISNNNIYFLGREAHAGTELFKYDIIDDRVSIVKDIKPGTDGIQIDPGQMTDVNGIVYFDFTDSTGTHLYKTTGTDSTTKEVKTFPSSFAFGGLTNGNGRLFFTASDSLTNSEPWVSNGTPAGTKILKEIYSGAIGSGAYYYTVCNNKLIFAATDPLHGKELWAANDSSTQIVKEINKTATASSGYGDIPIVPFKNGVLTTALTYDKGNELYKANATSESLVKDVFVGQLSGGPDYITVKNNVGYFAATVPAADTSQSHTAYSSIGGIGLNEAIFKTDGTTAGTVQITPSLNGSISDLTVTDNGTIFYALNVSGSWDIWKTDGTATGNVMLHAGLFFNEEFDEAGNRYIFKTIGNTVYFNAVDNSTALGDELWKSDGTAKGTTIVKDINAGINSSNPTQLTVFNNQLYFSANDGFETALWKSDGTKAGTVKLKSVQPFSFAVSNKLLFFNGYNSTKGAELWKTDGTKAGTVLVKDINIGADGSNPAHLTDVNDTLYFSASDSTHNTQLWKSNGTNMGTRLVKNIAPATDTALLAFFTNAAGKLFFTVNNKIWRSDGTGRGTGVLSDQVLDNLLAYNLASNGNQLFFKGYNYQYGYELYAGDVSENTSPVNIAPFTALLQSADVVTRWKQNSVKNNTAYFNIQRSTDAVHFTTIGKVVANGNNSGLQQYTFSDENIAAMIAAKTIYYRLEAMDKDGKATLSHLASVDLSNKDIMVHPNPAKDRINLRFNNYSGNAIINIYDLAGKKLIVTQQTAQGGNTISINVSSLPTGIYIIKVNMNNKTVQQKFIKE